MQLRSLAMAGVLLLSHAWAAGQSPALPAAASPAAPVVISNGKDAAAPKDKAHRRTTCRHPGRRPAGAAGQSGGRPPRRRRRQ